MRICGGPFGPVGRIGRPLPMGGREVGWIGRDTGKVEMRSLRGLPLTGGGMMTGLDGGCGRGIDFGQIQPNPRVVAVHGGEDEDPEDHVPLIRQWVLRATRIEIPTGGQGGGDEDIGVHVPEQETIDSLRAQIDQLREWIQTLMTERDTTVRRHQDT